MSTCQLTHEGLEDYFSACSSLEDSSCRSCDIATMLKDSNIPLQWTESSQQNIRAHDWSSLTINSIDLVAIRENGHISQLGIINVKELSKLQDQPLLPFLHAEERAHFRSTATPKDRYRTIGQSRIYSLTVYGRCGVHVSWSQHSTNQDSLWGLALTAERATTVTFTWFCEES